MNQGASREGQENCEATGTSLHFFSLLPKRLCAYWSPTHIPMRKGINKWRLGTSLKVSTLVALDAQGMYFVRSSSFSKFRCAKYDAKNRRNSGRFEVKSVEKY